MKVQAKAKYLKISAHKLRLSADLVRGLRVVEATDVLRTTNKKSAVLVGDALKSAVANAENNLNLAKRNLTIDSITVDEGPMLKRFRPRARGSAGRILHRMAHLTIVLSDEQIKAEAEKAAQAENVATKSDAPVASTAKKVIKSAQTVKKETK